MPVASSLEGRCYVADHQTLISFDELTQVEITCVCGTGLVIGALSTAPHLRNDCPGCGRSLSNAQQAVHAFRQLYSNAKSFTGEPKEDSNPVPMITARTLKFRVSEDGPL